MTGLTPAKDCQSMADLRLQIDTIDRQLIALLLTRSQYIDRAVDLKRSEGLPARIGDRVAEVIGNVTSEAARTGLDPALAETLWTELIEWSIARESSHLG